MSRNTRSATRRTLGPLSLEHVLHRTHPSMSRSTALPGKNWRSFEKSLPTGGLSRSSCTSLLSCARLALPFRAWVSNEASSPPRTSSLLIEYVDETVVNGGQIFYRPQFGIDGKDSRSTWLTGLVNSAPYLCCAFIGCWLTVPFNNLFGRRGTIFITCAFSALACFWQGFVNTWWHLFIARFALGFGIGPKSATVPIYAAETTPPGIHPFSTIHQY